MEHSAGMFVAMLALVGAVIVIAALLSGAIERSRLPQMGVFLALGACVGAAGLGVMHVPLSSPVLQGVSVLALALVLFMDAVGLDLAEVRRHVRLAALVVGPATLTSAALIALAAWWVLDVPLAAGAVLGAALASTDPVLLRGVFRNRALPSDARLALRLESGLNDAVLLPVLLAAMAFLRGDAPELTPMALRVLLLGPAAGVAVGLAGIAALDLVRRRVGVRRDYESLYSLGLAFLAYAGGEALHGSGFLAAFAAGLTIAVLDVELCECFVEYGETTGEMALLLTFVLLGSGPIWMAADVFDLKTVAFALLVLAARPIAFLVALAPARLESRTRWLIAWFGPRGLGSLLLALLPVFAGVPGAERLFATCCLVVLLSLVVHGGSIMLLERADAGGTLGHATTRLSALRGSEARAAQPAGAGGETAGDGLVTVEDVQRLAAEGADVVLVDVRTEKALRASGQDLVGAARIDPDRPAAPQAAARSLPRDGVIAAFCA